MKNTILAATIELIAIFFAISVHAQTLPQIPSPPQASKTQTNTATPTPELARPTVWGEPTVVKVGIFIINIDTIDAANEQFAASVYIEARWKNPLLRHPGPGPLMRDATEVWTPRLAILNQQQGWPSFPNTVEISPDGECVYRQKIWGWFSQPLDLHDFPLDRQNLEIQLVAAGLFASEVKMVPLSREHGRTSGIAQNISLADFKVIKWTAESQPFLPYKGQVGTAGFRVNVEVEREPDFYIWKIILPLCLIVIMSWIPRWVSATKGDSNLGIAVTSFLTLVAYLFAVTVLLPRVPYFTRMDEFVFMSTMLVFISLAQTVAHEMLVEKGQAAIVERINLVSRAIYPLLLILDLAIAFMR